MSLASEELVDRFLDAIWMERGLSQNTLGAYRADLMTLGRSLAEQEKTIEQAEKADLLAFIASRVEGGAKTAFDGQAAVELSPFLSLHHARRTARQRSDSRHRNASNWPITAEDVERGRSRCASQCAKYRRTAGSPRPGDARACFTRPVLRVSELINLKQSQINFNQGVLRIVGKGDRERLIPLGEESQRWLRDFIDGPRMEILARAANGLPVSDPAWRSHDAPGVLAHYQALRGKGRGTQKTLAAQSAARVCDAPSQQGCRSQGRPASTWP